MAREVDMVSKKTKKQLEEYYLFQENQKELLSIEKEKIEKAIEELKILEEKENIVVNDLILQINSIASSHGYTVGIKLTWEDIKLILSMSYESRETVDIPFALYPIVDTKEILNK